MDFYLTLVAADAPLSVGHIATTQTFAEKNGLFITGAPVWLCPNKATDIPLAEALTMEQMQALRSLHDGAKIDIFCTSASQRKKTLLIADMDSTIVTSETLDELAVEAGLKDKISGITARAMRGELDFHAALKERISLLAGLSAGALARTLNGTKVSVGADSLVKTMRNHGSYCVLASGGFTFFTSAISAKLGFSAHHGNELEIIDNKLSGFVKEPILDKDAKLRFLKLYCEELGIELSESVAIGDGANDLPMLINAGLGIGYQPKPLLEQTLLNCIRHTDLISVLYAQGYKEEEIAPPANPIN